MTSSRSGVTQRLSTLALAAALLVAGGIHFHPEDSASTHWDTASGDVLRSAASHPQAPLHMERVDVERAPRCPVCLLRDKSAAVRPDPTPSYGADRPADGFAAALPLATIQRAGDPGRPRGPPLL